MYKNSSVWCGLQRWVTDCLVRYGVSVSLSSSRRTVDSAVSDSGHRTDLHCDAQCFRLRRWLSSQLRCELFRASQWLFAVSQQCKFWHNFANYAALSCELFSAIHQNELQLAWCGPLLYNKIFWAVTGREGSWTDLWPSSEIPLLAVQ